MDGSLGIAFYYKGDWIVATRGSFVSEQATKATEMLKGLSILRNYPTTGLRNNWTYLFEIIYKENRIVCNYDFEGLVLLGAYDRDTLKEIEFETLVKSVALFPDVKVVRKYNGVTDFKKLKEMISDDREGYVIRFKSGKRMKIKGDEYVRLHRILTNFSTTDIWELLRTGGNIGEFLESVPDEFDNWVKETVRDLVVRYENLKKEYEWIYEHIMRVEKATTDRKVFSEFALRYKHSKLLFMMLDGKDVSDYVWKQIKPKWSKAFHKDIDS
jgi:RNA ligase